jgi:hypothetical protein
MAKRRLVPASTIRDWAFGRGDFEGKGGSAALAAADAPLPGSRGRLHPDTVKVFKRENKSLDYAEKVSEGLRVEVPVPARDKAGRNITRKVSLPADEFRDLASTLGVAKDTGRISQAAREAVGAALMQD